MIVNYRCPNVSCRKVLQAPDGMREEGVRCGYCKTKHLVPQAGVHQKKPEDMGSRATH